VSDDEDAFEFKAKIQRGNGTDDQTAAEKPVAVADGGTDKIENRRWIESKLQSCRMVNWDRFTVGDWGGEQYINVYGWIDRDDSYKDFVLVIFWPESEGIYHTTSSAEHTEDITQKLHGEEGGHNDCRRVEHTFDVPNSIEVDDDPEAVTDGGRRCRP